ncbi:MAG: MarC family protein [Candidatus Marinimicrobia bacterium]|nr:MarC family protein [Candidatus Neomarinimicrobiota bacterium]
MTLDFNAFMHAFVTLLVIMDPFGGLPVFMTLTKDYPEERAKHSAHRATRVSLILLTLFVFVGEGILEFFSITMFSFQVGGGLILLSLGLLYVLGVTLGDDKDYSKDIVIPMATPLIAGPGAITAIIILVSQYGFWVPLLAMLLNLFIFWLAMYYAKYIKKFLGEQGLEIMSRVMGLLLVALAIEMIRTAWIELL